MDIGIEHRFVFDRIESKFFLQHKRAQARVANTILVSLLREPSRIKIRLPCSGIICSYASCFLIGSNLGLHEIGIRNDSEFRGALLDKSTLHDSPDSLIPPRRCRQALIAQVRCPIGVIIVRMLASELLRVIVDFLFCDDRVAIARGNAFIALLNLSASDDGHQGRKGDEQRHEQTCCLCFRNHLNAPFHQSTKNL